MTRCQRLRYGILAFLMMLMCIVLTPAQSQSLDPSLDPSLDQSLDPSVDQLVGQSLNEEHLDTSQSLFETGQYAEAIRSLQQVIQQAELTGDITQQGVAWSNLSLVWQSMGQWAEAEDAIAQSLDRLTLQDNADASLLAQVLDVQGQLYFSQGHFQAALETWEKSSDLYAEAHDQSALVRVGINRAEALQSLGLYRQAIALLTTLSNTVTPDTVTPDTVTSDTVTSDTVTSDTVTPDTVTPMVTQAIALRRLGDALRVSGDLEQSRHVLNRSFALAQQLNNRPQMVRSQLSLGNTAYSAGEVDTAWQQYDQVIRQTRHQTNHQNIADSGAGLVSIQAQLNQLRILVDRAEEGADDGAQTHAAIETLVSSIEQLPLNADAITTRINFAKTLLRLATLPTHQSSLAKGGGSAPPTYSSKLSLMTLATRELVMAYQQSHSLGHQRLNAIALTTLGELYETNHQFQEAQHLTEQALTILPSQSEDVAYQLYWQLGRIHAAKGERQEAIADYNQAVTTLKGLRNDLVAVSANAQFSFRSGVEPVYRELASLLLDPGYEPTVADLEHARNTIEQLQLAELDNFFREACLDTTEVTVDEVDSQAAIFYPIILSDRLELIVSLPTPDVSPLTKGGLRGVSPKAQAPTNARILQRYTTPVSAETVDRTVTTLIQFLRQPSANWRSPPLSQQVYDWLIRPAESALETSGVDTLVFVLDGTLRNLPMAVLQDGDTFLIEKYAVALTPGLQLFDSQALPAGGLTALVGGLSESRQDFPALPGVQTELNDIQSQLPQSEVLLNETFTSRAIQDAINQVPFPVVHLATHGEFSSNLDDTYILTWSDRLSIDQLNRTLQAGELSRDRPIELLVLSACQTAEGDDLAALGLAGMAVRAGARSTVATLWQLSDAASPILMERFYRELKGGDVTKAQALRQAQLTLLHNPTYSRPYFWSPVVLVGNWT